MAAVAAPTVEIGLSANAAVEIKKFMTSEDDLPESAGLRVRVVPGGCSGFQYSLNIEEESKQGDFLVEKHGVRLFVDMFSAQYLNGVVVDYTSNMMGSGFTFENPNATAAAAAELHFQLSSKRLYLESGMQNNICIPLFIFQFSKNLN